MAHQTPKPGGTETQINEDFPKPLISLKEKEKRKETKKKEKESRGIIVPSQEDWMKERGQYGWFVG